MKASVKLLGCMVLLLVYMESSSDRSSENERVSAVTGLARSSVTPTHAPIVFEPKNTSNIQIAMATQTATPASIAVAAQQDETQEPINLITEELFSDEVSEPKVIE